MQHGVIYPNRASYRLAWCDMNESSRNVDFACQCCGRQLKANNPVGYCQQTAACRRAYRRMKSPQLLAISDVERACSACGSRLRADNVSGYCQRPGCRRTCRRENSERLLAISDVDRECSACSSRLRADNVSGYCNAPECRRIWECFRGRLRRAGVREYQRNYQRVYQKAHPERYALIRAKRRAKSSDVPFSLTEAELPPI